MSQLFRFPDSVKRSPAAEAWLGRQKGELGKVARHWLEELRQSGDDVREVLHDGHPTVCVGDAAFAYVDTFPGHVNVGFFRGADLADPRGLLVGRGKFMRQVKIRPDSAVDAAALKHLVRAAHADMKRRVQDEAAACPAREAGRPIPASAAAIFPPLEITKSHSKGARIATRSAMSMSTWRQPNSTPCST